MNTSSNHDFDEAMTISENETEIEDTKESETEIEDIIEDTKTSDDDIEEVLPSLTKRTYSTYARSRRSIGAVPFKYRNSMIRCIEYPKGVFINKEGMIDLDNHGRLATDENDNEEDELNDEEFELLPPAKKMKILHDLKHEKEKEEKEEIENLEYDDKIKNDVNSSYIDSNDLVSYIRGDDEYIPSSCDELESDNESESECDENNEDTASDADSDENEDEDNSDSNDSCEDESEPDCDDKIEHELSV
jgi:hypothetical protein